MQLWPAWLCESESEVKQSMKVIIRLVENANPS